MESRADDKGLLSEEDAKTYAEMERTVKDYGAEIERRRGKQTSRSLEVTCIFLQWVWYSISGQRKIMTA